MAIPNILRCFSLDLAHLLSLIPNSLVCGSSWLWWELSVSLKAVIRATTVEQLTVRQLNWGTSFSIVLKQIEIAT